MILEISGKGHNVVNTIICISLYVGTCNHTQEYKKFGQVYSYIFVQEISHFLETIWVLRFDWIMFYI